MQRFIFGLVISLGAIGAGVTHGDIIVSTGYNDGLGEDTLPSPWVGSANTVAIGNATQLIYANSSDPDLDAVLFHNTGASAVTLSGAKFATAGVDLFALAGQSAPVTIAPGENLIVLGVDGSDQLGFARQTVDFTINGTAYSALDAVTPDAFDGVLCGKVNWSVAETQPWAEIADIATSVPEPSAITLAGVASLVLAAAWSRKRRHASN